MAAARRRCPVEGLAAESRDLSRPCERAREILSARSPSFAPARNAMHGTTEMRFLGGHQFSRDGRQAGIAGIGGLR
jgi:hypothetical protein